MKKGLALFALVVIVVLVPTAVTAKILTPSAFASTKLSSASLVISSTIVPTYEAKATVKFSFISDTNYPTLLFVARFGNADYPNTILASDSSTYSDYTSSKGTITITMSFYLDADASNWNLQKDDTALAMIGVYEGSTATSDKLLDLTSATATYPFSEDSKTNSWGLYILAGLGLLAFGVVIIFYLSSSGRLQASQSTLEKHGFEIQEKVKRQRKNVGSGLLAMERPSQEQQRQAMREQRRREFQQKARQGSFTAGQQKISRYTSLREKWQQGRL